MTFNFTKEIIQGIYLSDLGPLDNCRVYTIFDNASIAGQFYCTDSAGFIKSGPDHIRLNIEKRQFRNSAYTLIDEIGNRQIGYYEISNWSGALTPLGKLIIGENVYQCHKRKPFVKKNIFKRSTWGHYNAEVSNHDKTEMVTYSLQLDLSLTGSKEFSPFTGSVNLKGENKLLLLAGLFLLEQVFNHDDNNADR